MQRQQVSQKVDQCTDCQSSSLLYLPVSFSLWFYRGSFSGKWYYFCIPHILFTYSLSVHLLAGRIMPVADNRDRSWYFQIGAIIHEALVEIVYMSSED